jgi:hypothetical protein
MKREDLIKQCRYYSGEEKCPFNEERMEWFWDMERVYVSSNGNFVGETELYHRLKGRRYTGIPHNLLMVMFTGWAKYVVEIEKNLPKFYDLMEVYLDIVSDHLPKSAIPG